MDEDDHDGYNRLSEMSPSEDEEFDHGHGFIQLMTTEELLAIPEDGTDRWLIAGELRERPMTRRNRFHSRVTFRVAEFPSTGSMSSLSPKARS